MNQNGRAFEQYVLHTRQQIAAVSHPSDATMLQRRIDANSPFQWYPSTFDTQPIKRGVLLIHGLLDSPYSMRAIGNTFLQQQFLVRSILLPGHGTQPRALLSVTYQDWIESAQKAIIDLQETVDELFLVGFSSGASLALIHAPILTKLRGIVMIAPAMRLSEKLAKFAFLMKPLRHITPAWAWHEISDESDYAKYQSLPYSLAAEAYSLSQVTKKQAAYFPASCPLLMAISDSDETVSANAAIDFFNQTRSDKNCCILYTSNPQRYSSLPATFIVRNTDLPAQHILDYSHVCLPIAPEDPHYGIRGDYTAPVHLKHRTAKNTALVQSIQLGALSSKNLKKYPMRRLLFNPDFGFLTQRIEQFIQQHAPDLRD